MITEISVVELRDNVSAAINRAAYGCEQLVITRHRKPVAALVSYVDLQLLQRIKQEDCQQCRD